MENKVPLPLKAEAGVVKNSSTILINEIQRNMFINILEMRGIFNPPLNPPNVKSGQALQGGEMGTVNQNITVKWMKNVLI